MADQESQRSVLPNGQLIDAMRKRKGWTIKEFSENADISLRTAQKAVSGRPIGMGSLKSVASCLEVAFASLRLIEEDLAPSKSLSKSPEATTDFSLTLTMHGSVGEGGNLKSLMTLSPTILASLAQAGIKISGYDSKLQITERVGPDRKRIIVILYGLLDSGGPFWVFAAVMPTRYKAFIEAQKGGALSLYEFDPYGEIIISGEGKDPPEDVILQVATMYETTPEHLMDLADEPSGN